MNKRFKLSSRILIALLGTLGLISCKQASRHLVVEPELYGGPVKPYTELADSAMVENLEIYL